MLNPDAMVRYYGLPTERVANNPGSKTAPTWKAVKRANGDTDYIPQPDENTYEKIQRAGNKAKSTLTMTMGSHGPVYTQGLPK